MTITSVAPTIDANGITAPTLPELLQYLEEQYKGIFGSDIYLGPDSQDGQFLAILASALNDTNAAAIAVYNAFSPATAQGTGLSNIVKINGLKRHVSSYSTVDIYLTGVAGTIINNGVVKDANGYKWDLPATVTLDTQGQAVATATCETLGAVVALPNTVNQIQTPTRGWQAAINAAQATTGANVEADGALRIRQSVSTALPSQSSFQGVVASVGNVVNVKRYRVYENTGAIADNRGIAPHSIAAVVEGGAATDIGRTINLKKPPGTGTYGSTSTEIADVAGNYKVIEYSRPVYVSISVEIALTALSGYAASVGDSIRQAIANSINAQQIGATIYHGQLYGPANLDGGTGSNTFNITSLALARTGNTPDPANIDLAYNEAASITSADVTLTIT